MSCSRFPVESDRCVQRTYAASPTGRGSGQLPTGGTGAGLGGSGSGGGIGLGGAGLGGDGL